MTTRENLIGLVNRYGGEWAKVAEALSRHEIATGLYRKEKCITILDEEYPEELRKLRYPPWVLFYEGDITLLKCPKVTIVGSRELSIYGYRMTKYAASILKKKYVLISGLAKGADACVHEEAMCGGKTIAVIGSGLGTQYPAENRYLYDKIRTQHLLLSEYPYDVGVRKHHFPWRNRILAGLGESVVVTQAKTQSGTMLTVNEAIQMAKDVYCFPYPFDEENGSGCNRLIADGAYILCEKAQLYEI